MPQSGSSRGSEAPNEAAQVARGLEEKDQNRQARRKARIPVTEEKKTDPYDHADYYECSGRTEQLSWESPELAIERFLDDDMQPGCDVEAVIRRNSPLTCTAYARKEVPRNMASSWARALVDQLNDYWTDQEFGDPDGEPDVLGGTELVEALTPIIQAAIDRTTVWACDAVGERTYEAEELIAMMREESPHWFEEKTEATL